jgi:N-methylhydantoinase B
MQMQVDISEPAVANTAGDGIRYAPYGVFGGEDGLPHRYRLISKGRTRFLKTKEVGIPVQPGDVFYIESSGGGGYGHPLQRDPDAHAADIANGFVTGKKRVRRSPRAES